MYWSPRGRIFVLHSILLISSCFTLTKIKKFLGRPWVDPGATQNNIPFYFQIIQANHKQVMKMKYSAPGGLDKGLNQLWFQWQKFWEDSPIELQKPFYYKKYDWKVWVDPKQHPILFSDNSS